MIIGALVGIGGLGFGAPGTSASGSNSIGFFNSASNNFGFFNSGDTTYRFRRTATNTGFGNAGLGGNRFLGNASSNNFRFRQLGIWHMNCRQLGCLQHRQKYQAHETQTLGATSIPAVDQLGISAWRRHSGGLDTGFGSPGG